MAKVYVRQLVNRDEIVYEFEAPSPVSIRQHERMMLGLLRNMRSDCFADDSEVEILSTEP
jgi:hypothetical protein